MTESKQKHFRIIVISNEDLSLGLEILYILNKFQTSEILIKRPKLTTMMIAEPPILRN